MPMEKVVGYGKAHSPITPPFGIGVGVVDRIIATSNFYNLIESNGVAIVGVWAEFNDGFILNVRPTFSVLGRGEPHTTIPTLM